MSSSSRGGSEPPPEVLANQAADQALPPGFTPITPQQIPQSPVQYPSFLPDSGMASGLTPAMIEAIRLNNGLDYGQPPTTTQQVAQAAASTSPEAAAPDPAAAEEARARLALLMMQPGLAPENRLGGRMPFDNKTGTFSRNPDWRPTNRAGQRASSPGWGGRTGGLV